MRCTYLQCSYIRIKRKDGHCAIATQTDHDCACLPSSPVTVVPAAPIPQGSILRLIAKVDPDFAVAKIIWAGPGGVSMKSEKKPNTGTVAKLPQVQRNEQGAYICMVRPWGNSSSGLFPFNVDVSVDGEMDLRELKHIFFSILLMVGVGISARNSSSSIIYLSIVYPQFFKVFYFYRPVLKVYCISTKNHPFSCEYYSCCVYLLFIPTLPLSPSLSSPLLACLHS